MTGKDTRPFVALAAAACVACCIGPIMAVLGAVGIGTVVGVAVFGLAGLGIAVLAVLTLPAYLRSRRRATYRGNARPDTVPVSAPSSRHSR